MRIDLGDAPPRPGAAPPPDGGAWGLEYWALPEEGIELTLEVRAAQPVMIRVVDRTQGLPDTPGQSITPRPDYIMPAPQIGIARFSNSTMVSRSFTF